MKSCVTPVYNNIHVLHTVGNITWRKLYKFARIATHTDGCIWMLQSWQISLHTQTSIELITVADILLSI